MAIGETRRAPRSTLLKLVEFSLARGEYQMACQRLLMMDACQMDIPSDLRSACSLHLGRIAPRELRRMHEEAREFAEFLRDRWGAAAIGCCSSSPAERSDILDR